MAGLEARLTPRGAGRWSRAAFFGVWLLFWIVGEAFALWILIAGGWALFTGQPSGPGRAPLELAPALFTGIFLLAWVSFWTFGGLIAWHEFFRLLWSSDRLLARNDGLEITHRIGPFRRRRLVPRDHLRRLFRIETLHTVQLETAGGVMELTRNGTATEQNRLVAALTAALRLPSPDQLPPLLPSTWRELRSHEGDAILVRNPATRRTQARVMWLIALPLTWAALMVLNEALTKPNLVGATVILGLVAGLALWGAARLTWSRKEWRLDPGRLVGQRRAGTRRREQSAGDALRLVESTDSDGDPWFELMVLKQGDLLHKLHQGSHDPTEPRQLGQWLALRTGLPFEDRATPEARAQAAADKAEAAAAARAWLRDWASSLPGFKRRR